MSIECTKCDKTSVAPIDAKHTPPNNDAYYALGGCPPDCFEETCRDIQSGEFEFTGPGIVRGLCGLTKSYVIVKVEADDCELNVNAVWPTGRVVIDEAGPHKVLYSWDACCEDEPKFVKSDCPDCPA